MAGRERDDRVMSPLKNGNVKEEKGGEKMKKIMAMFAAIMISLAVVGFSYATWYSSAFIVGNATLGTIDLRHDSFYVKNQTTPAATITPTYTDTDHKLTLNIGPVYPGWKAFMWVNLVNKGNLPLKFYSFQMTNRNDTTLAGYFNLGFLTSENGPYNVGPINLNYYWDLHTYEGNWGIGPQYITLQPNEVHWSLISVGVADGIPKDYQGQTLSVTFEFQATLAIS